MGFDRPFCARVAVGRVLRCVGEVVPRPEGNPLYKCADCGKSVAAMGSDALCWCGYSHKHNHNATAYVCKPFAILQDHPEFLRGVSGLWL